MKLAQEDLNLISEAASKDKPKFEDSTVPDLHLALEQHKHNFELQSLKQKLLEAQDTHNLRLDYIKRIFCLVCIWLALVVISVFLSGFKLYNFALPNSVLIAFITSTTISVVGLFIVVSKWLFPISNQNQKE